MGIILPQTQPKTSSPCAENGMTVKTKAHPALEKVVKCVSQVNANKPLYLTSTQLKEIGRAVFAQVDLDIVTENTRILKKLCRNKGVKVVGVVKGNAYGHGAVPVAQHLLSEGVVDRLAVANIPEGVQLRKAGAGSVIHILGNIQPWEMESCLRYQLVPTVSTLAALEGMAGAMKRWEMAAREKWGRLKGREGACLEEIGEIEEYLRGCFESCDDGIGCRMEKFCLTSAGCSEKIGVNDGKVCHNGFKCEMDGYLQNGVDDGESLHNGLEYGCKQNGMISAYHSNLNCDVEDVAKINVNNMECKEKSARKQIAQNKNLKAGRGDKTAINPEKLGPVPEFCLNSACSLDLSVVKNQTGYKTSQPRLNGQQPTPQQLLRDAAATQTTQQLQPALHQLQSGSQQLQPGLQQLLSAPQLLRNLCLARVAQLREELDQLRQQLVNLVSSAAAAETNKKYDKSQGLKNVISEIDTGNPWINDGCDNGISERKNGNQESHGNSASLNETNEIKIIPSENVKLVEQIFTGLEFPANLAYRCGLPLGTVHIKVDTGMSRNGCQPQDLDSLVQACRDLGVPLEGIFSHIASHEEPDFSQQQMDSFQKCTEKYQGSGLIFHISNSGAICYDIGTDMDMVRPGLSMFGMPAGPDLDEFIHSLGFRPALSVRGTPTLVKLCHKGTKVGYGGTYTCEVDQWIGTFPLGYADGYWRETGQIGGQFVVRESTGERCPLVGRISMDAITVRLPGEPLPGELFSIVTADFDPVSSVTGMAEQCRTTQDEALTRITARLPRVYSTNSNPMHSVWSALDLDLAMSDDYCDLLSQNWPVENLLGQI